MKAATLAPAARTVYHAGTSFQPANGPVACFCQ